MNKKQKTLKTIEADKLVHVVGGDNTEPLPWLPQGPNSPVKSKQ